MRITIPFLFNSLLPDKYYIPELERFPPDRKSALLEEILKSKEFTNYNQRMVAIPALTAAIVAGSVFSLVPCAIQEGIPSAMVLAGEGAITLLVGYVFGFLWRSLWYGAVYIVVFVFFLAGLVFSIKSGLGVLMLNILTTAIVFQLCWLLGIWLMWPRAKTLLRSIAKQHLAAYDMGTAQVMPKQSRPEEPGSETGF